MTTNSHKNYQWESNLFMGIHQIKCNTQKESEKKTHCRLIQLWCNVFSIFGENLPNAFSQVVYLCSDPPHPPAYPISLWPDMLPLRVMQTASLPAAPWPVKSGWLDKKSIQLELYKQLLRVSTSIISESPQQLWKWTQTTAGQYNRPAGHVTNA